VLLTWVEQLLLALASLRTPFSLVGLSNFGMVLLKCNYGLVDVVMVNEPTIDDLDVLGKLIDGAVMLS
jgi:hypothetical protein